MDISDILKHVVDSSSQLSSWALILGGGSVAVMVGSSYHRPSKFWWRLPYFLYVPGWLCLGVSLKLGNDLAKKYLASLMVSQGDAKTIANQVNDIYDLQQCWFMSALCFFGLWLLIYTIYWVCSKSYVGERK